MFRHALPVSRDCVAPKARSHISLLRERHRIRAFRARAYHRQANTPVVEDEAYLAASSSQSLRQAARNPSRFSSRQGSGSRLVPTPSPAASVPPPPSPVDDLPPSRPSRWIFRAPVVWGIVFACIENTCSRLRPHARRTIVCTVLFTCRLVIDRRRAKLPKPRFVFEHVR